MKTTRLSALAEHSRVMMLMCASARTHIRTHMQIHTHTKRHSNAQAMHAYTHALAPSPVSSSRFLLFWPCLPMIVPASLSDTTILKVRDRKPIPLSPPPHRSLPPSSQPPRLPTPARPRALSPGLTPRSQPVPPDLPPPPPSSSHPPAPPTHRPLLRLRCRSSPCTFTHSSSPRGLDHSRSLSRPPSRSIP